MAEADWDTVTYLRKKAPGAREARSQKQDYIDLIDYDHRSLAHCLDDVILRSTSLNLVAKVFDTEWSYGQEFPVKADKRGIFIQIDSAGTNKQKNMDQNTAKLDRETEELHHKHVTLDVGKAIMKGRQAKNLTQKELATRINEKPQVINEYESGKAITNQQILAKIERVLGVKLRGKDIGQPLGSKKK